MFLSCCPLLAIIPMTLFTDICFDVSDSQAGICVRPAELITLPLPSLSLWDPLEITIQYHFPASAAQRPVGGALVMENYQLAQMKWPLEKTSQNISPSLSLSVYLSLSQPLYFALPPSQFDSLSLLVGSTPLKPSRKSIFEEPQFCTISISPSMFSHGRVLNDN